MNLVHSKELPHSVKTKITDANIFFSNKYASYLELKNDQFYFAFDQERIIPIRVRNKFVFKWTILLSEPFNLIDNPETPLEDFLDSVINCLESKLSSMWTISTASGLFNDTPLKRCLRIPFGSHVIDLTQNQDALWNNIHSKHKNVIRKAIKEDIEVKKGGQELLDDYLALDEETWKRSNTSSPGKKYYSDQLELLSNNIIIYIAYKNGKPQAGAIFYYNSAMSYYMYGCSANNSMTGSANYLQWTAINDMKKEGVKKYSFVGCRINEDKDSKYHGIQRFKERFGGNLEQGYLFRVVSKPLMYKLFCICMQIRSRSAKPYQDAIDEEISKWRNIQK